MKIIASGDFHLDLMVAGYDYHDDIVKAMRQVVDATHGADLFVHLGDLFDNNRPTPRAYAAAIELLYQVGCPVIMIRGNHDPDALEPFKKMEFGYEVRVLDLPTVVEVGGKRLLFAGHVRDADVKSEKMNAQEFLNWIFEEARQEGEIVAAFTHLNVEGARIGDYVMRGQEVGLPKSAAMFPVVVNGHIHGRQRVGNVWMPGSLVQTDAGESGQKKGFIELEV